MGKFLTFDFHSLQVLLSIGVVMKTSILKKKQAKKNKKIKTPLKNEAFYPDSNLMYQPTMCRHTTF